MRERRARSTCAGEEASGNIDVCHCATTLILFYKFYSDSLLFEARYCAMCADISVSPARNGFFHESTAEEKKSQGEIFPFN